MSVLPRRALAGHGLEKIGPMPGGWRPTQRLRLFSLLVPGSTVWHSGWTHHFQIQTPARFSRGMHVKALWPFGDLVIFIKEVIHFFRSARRRHEQLRPRPVHVGDGPLHGAVEAAT